MVLDSLLGRVEGTLILAHQNQGLNRCMGLRMDRENQLIVSNSLKLYAHSIPYDEVL